MFCGRMYGALRRYYMKKTKIICSIGPASNKVEVMEQMVNAGMNVARINMSHNTHEEHQIKFDILHKIREKLSNL